MKRVSIFLAYVALSLFIFVAGCTKAIENPPKQLDFPGNWQLMVSNDDFMHGSAIITGNSVSGEMTFTFTCEEVTRTYKGNYQAYGRDIFAKLSVEWFPGLIYYLNLTGSIGDDGTINGVSTYENQFGEFTGTWTAVPDHDSSL